MKAQQVDIVFKILTLSGKRNFFLEHRGAGFEAVGGEDFEDFGQEFGDLFVAFVEAEEPLAE